MPPQAPREFAHDPLADAEAERARRMKDHRDRAHAKSFADLHPWELLYWDGRTADTDYRATGMRFSNAPCARAAVEFRGIGYAVRDNATGWLYTQPDLRTLPEKLTGDYELWLAVERARVRRIMGEGGPCQ